MLIVLMAGGFGQQGRRDLLALGQLLSTNGKISALNKFAKIGDRHPIKVYHKK
jgi:hypothetical protein